MTTTTKKTAANTPALARVKEALSAPAYKMGVQKMNEGGIDALRAYVRTFFTVASQHHADAIIDDV